MSDLNELLGRLTRGRVDFVIVGGYAAVIHGVTLVTRDVDICLRFTPTNLLRLQQAIADLHPVHRLTPQHLPLRLTKLKCAGLKNLYLATDFGVVDCLGEILGVGGFAEVRKRSILKTFSFGRCRVLDLDTLIKAKETMGRERDRQAAIQLRAIRARLGK